MGIPDLGMPNGGWFVGTKKLSAPNRPWLNRALAPQEPPRHVTLLTLDFTPYWSKINDIQKWLGPMGILDLGMPNGGWFVGRKKLSAPNRPWLNAALAPQEPPRHVTLITLAFTSPWSKN